MMERVAGEADADDIEHHHHHHHDAASQRDDSLDTQDSLQAAAVTGPPTDLVTSPSTAALMGNCNVPQSQ